MSPEGRAPTRGHPLCKLAARSDLRNVDSGKRLAQEGPGQGILALLVLEGMKAGDGHVPLVTDSSSLGRAQQEDSQSPGPKKGALVPSPRTEDLVQSNMIRVNDTGIHVVKLLRE